MERQGMARRRRLFLIGLLIFCGLLVPLAANEGEIPEVRVETFPANPTINNPWSIYLLVNHPNPLEVDVKPPYFPPFLVMERVRADTRFIVGEDRWTRVEFRFVPLREDIADLEPFEIRTPAGLAFTEEIHVRFGTETARRRYNPSFRWLTPVPEVSPGETAVLTLELTGWDPNRRFPEGFLSGQSPLNAIVGEGLPSLVREGVYRYPVNVIPLEESSITLGDYSFNYDDYVLNVPQIFFRVLPARFTAAEAAVVNIDETEFTGESIPEEVRVIPFPQTRENIFFLLQGEYDRTIARARALWDADRRAEALAELRRNERDSFSGPFLVSVRREIEQALGIGVTGDERWRPLKIPLALYAVFFVAVIAALVFLFVLRPRLATHEGKKNHHRNSFMGVIFMILAVGLAVILLEGSLGDFPATRSPGNTAVLKSTSGYRIPDSRGAVNEWFIDGQPVIVGGYSGDWRLAETPDGRSGWVPSEAVISY